MSEPTIPTPYSEAKSGLMTHRSIRAGLNIAGPVLALLVVYGLFLALRPESMRDWTNIETMARHATIVGIAACGMTIVIILGGIDLSVGSMVAMVTIVVAMILRWSPGGGSSLSAQWPILGPVLAAAGGMAAGAACGLLSGLLITGLRVVPFIVTLGMMVTLRGAAKGLANNQTILADPSWLVYLLQPVSGGRAWMLLPAGVWVLVAMALLAAGLLRYTPLGRHACAIGSSEQTARLCGVRVSRTKIIVYALSGMFVGLAGLMEFAKLRIGDPTTASGFELEVIAAVVIGGGSLSGGRGSILGSIAGALIMSVIGFGCTLLGLANYIQEIVTGGIIVAAVSLDQLRQGRS